MCQLIYVLGVSTDMSAWRVTNIFRVIGCNRQQTLPAREQVVKRSTDSDAVYLLR